MKKKLSFIPFHLLFSLPLLAGSFILFATMFKLDDFNSACIAIIIYIYDVITVAKMDYLEDKINNLENKVNDTLWD